jgi:hypothetical protein
MILSSEELEVLDYLKSWKGNYVSMVEICRCAGGRRKYKESPHWAKRLMSRLVEAEMVLVNERGHYAFKTEETAAAGNSGAMEDYFPQTENPLIVGDDYFAPQEPLPDLPPAKSKRWVSPQIESILKKAAQKPAVYPRHD